MEIKSTIRKVAVYLVIICLGILAGTQLRGTASATALSPDEMVSQARTEQAVLMSPNAEWHLCVPESVATYTTRIHIECATAIGNIKYFAVPTSESKHAARMLATMLTAHAAGMTASILFEPDDTSDLPPGCLEADCRLLLAVAVE
jgi:hypothetical protein